MLRRISAKEERERREQEDETNPISLLVMTELGASDHTLTVPEVNEVETPALRARLL